MTKTTKKEETKQPATRAEKRDATKEIIREILAKASAKSNDLIDEAAKLYAERLGGEGAENPNDVKGRIGSVLDVMKKDGEVLYEGGVCALKVETEQKKPTKKAKKTEEEKAAEKPAKAKRTAKKAVKEKEEKETETEERLPLPPAPIQPIAPTAPVTPEVAPEPIPAEKPAPKKRGRKAKTEEVKAEESKTEEVKTEEVKEEKPVETAQKADETPKGTVMDMSFLFGEVKPVKRDEQKREEKPAPAPAPVKEEAKKEVKAEEKKPEQKEEKPAQKPQAKKPEPKKPVREQSRKTAKKPLTADEKLQEAFLNRLHRLGGEYFEYYSVYLLEKYSRKNGRRLETLKITGGDHDGGIDGEIELTDKLGFRETIYIQSKNWDPDKGDERLWVVGETLLQQFIGACVCRQAKDGKQNCRGIFITTSRFTPEAKRLLDDTADKFVGYDGADLYETAKECEFGVIKKNGEWALDENLLSGTKAFFHMN